MRHIHIATCSLIENMYNQTTFFYIIPHFAQPNYPRESSFLFVCVLFIMYELLNVISVACKISASLCSLFIWRQMIRLIANMYTFYSSYYKVEKAKELHTQRFILKHLLLLLRQGTGVLVLIFELYTKPIVKLNRSGRIQGKINNNCYMKKKTFDNWNRFSQYNKKKTKTKPQAKTFLHRALQLFYISSYNITCIWYFKNISITHILHSKLLRRVVIKLVYVLNIVSAYQYNLICLSRNFLA